MLFRAFAPFLPRVRGLLNQLFCPDIDYLLCLLPLSARTTTADFLRSRTKVFFLPRFVGRCCVIRELFSIVLGQPIHRACETIIPVLLFRHACSSFYWRGNSRRHLLATRIGELVFAICLVLLIATLCPLPPDATALLLLSRRQM